MLRIRISLVHHAGKGLTVTADKIPPIEFDVRPEHVLPFMQSLEHLTATPELLVTAILAMDTAVTLTREDEEHPENQHPP